MRRFGHRRVLYPLKPSRTSCATTCCWALTLGHAEPGLDLASPSQRDESQ